MPFIKNPAGLNFFISFESPECYKKIQQFQIWKSILRKKRKVVVLFLGEAQKQHNNK